MTGRKKSYTTCHDPFGTHQAGVIIDPLMAFVELAGARLWFEDSGGTGVAVVFVHPAATTSECWVYQVEAFTRAGYRCITYDLRGWGKSQMDADADVGTMSDDLEALVRALKIEAIIL